MLDQGVSRRQELSGPGIAADDVSPDGAVDLPVGSAAWSADGYLHRRRPAVPARKCVLTGELRRGRLLEATDSFDIELVEAEDYDYDGDGVVVADAVYGGGWGDCDPDDPTVHGAAADGSVAAAAEICDNLDNDCSGVVNDGLPDPEGGDTLAAATGLGGTIPTLGSGDSAADQGSLYSEEDVDWWYFEVSSDYGRTQNVRLTIAAVVPAGGGAGPAGTWSAFALTATSAASSTSLRPVLPGGTDCSTIPGSCVLTWTVAGDERQDGELSWWVGLGASDWDAEMCSEHVEIATYTLTLTNDG